MRNKKIGIIIQLECSVRTLFKNVIITHSAIMAVKSTYLQFITDEGYEIHLSNR